MYFILALLVSHTVQAETSKQECLRNFLFPLTAGPNAGPGPVIVGDSIIEPLADGAIVVHRPNGSTKVATDGVRCTGEAGKEHGAWAFLANILTRRSNQGAFTEAEKNRLRIVAQYCWDLSPKLNEAISSSMTAQKLAPPPQSKGSIEIGR